MQTLRFFRGSMLLVMAALLVSAGCTPRQAKKGGEGHGHDHPDAGPHGGALAEWGDEEYHVEFTVDHAKKQATVYILDKDAKKAVAVNPEKVTLTITNETPPLKIVLKGEPQPGDGAGLASKFVGTDDKLGVEKEFKGEIAGEVNGKPYSGTFEEKAGHDHKK